MGNYISVWHSDMLDENTLLWEEIRTLVDNMLEKNSMNITSSSCNSSNTSVWQKMFMPKTICIYQTNVIACWSYCRMTETLPPDRWISNNPIHIVCHACWVTQSITPSLGHRRSVCLMLASTNWYHNYSYEIESINSSFNFSLSESCCYLYDPLHINGLPQECGNSSANALELPQSWAKPSI